MKVCTKCGALKPLDEFYRRPGRPSGYKSACKACLRAAAVAWAAANPERRKAQNAARYPERQKVVSINLEADACTDERWMAHSRP